MCIAHSDYGGLFTRYNENGNISSVKMMSHVDMLSWATDHPPPTNMYVILTLQDGAFKDVVLQLHNQKYDILVVNIFLAYFFFGLFPKKSQQQQQQLKCSTTIIMAKRINNEMPKIQAIKKYCSFSYLTLFEKCSNILIK